MQTSSNVVCVELFGEVVIPTTIIGDDQSTVYTPPSRRWVEGTKKAFAAIIGDHDFPENSEYILGVYAKAAVIGMNAAQDHIIMRGLFESNRIGR